MRKTTLAALAACSLLLFAGAAHAQGELEQQVSQALSRADGGPLSAVFANGAELAGIGEAETLARLVNSAAQKAGNKGRLAAAVALRELAEGDLYGKEILTLLTPVASSSEVEEQAIALSILGD